MLIEKVYSENYPSLATAARSFGIDARTLRRWLKASGKGYEGYTPMIVKEELEQKPKEQTVQEKKKELSFLEPDPDPSTFKSDADKANYYMLRAYYLEELFRLCDLDEVSKKKALKQLEQRVRERLARGDKSPY